MSGNRTGRDMFHVHFSKRHVAICLAMLALVCAAFGKAEAEEQTAIDIQSYELRIDLDLTHTSYDIAENSLHGTAQITLRNRSGAPIVSLPVVLNRLLKLKTATDGDHRPLDIDQHLTELKDWENFQVRAASIHLKMPLAPDQTMRLTLTYEGALASYQESGMDYVRDRLDPAFTILRPENVSYPMFAEPTAASVQARWGSEADVFDQRLIVTVPKGERVIYSGRLVAEGKNEKTATFDYASQKPSGFFITAIAPYAELQRGRSRVLFFEQDRNNAEQQFADAMVRGAEVLTSWFGPMPSSSGGIEVVEIPENYGSQTISPMIIQTADALAKFNPLYHELSHLWDIRSTDPAPARWEEGLAMFVASLVEVQADHKTAARDSSEKAVCTPALSRMLRCGRCRWPLTACNTKRISPIASAGCFLLCCIRPSARKSFSILCIASATRMRRAPPSQCSRMQSALLGLYPIVWRMTFLPARPVSIN